MIQLNKIYFDGKGYAKKLIESNDSPTNEIIKIYSRFNFTPIDSVSFESNLGSGFCNITIGDHYIENVSIKYLFTNIENSLKTKVYPLHNPTPDPGGLYWQITKIKSGFL